MAPTVLSSSPISIGLVPTIRSPNSARMTSMTTVSGLKNPIFSSSLVSFGLVPTFRSPKSARMMSITTVSGLKNPSPCLMLPPTFEGGDDMVYNMYNLAQNKVLKFNNKKLMPEEDTQFVGSSHGWLSLFNERNCDLVLTNPVTRRHVKLPPPININASDGVKVILSCDAEQEECQAMMIDNDQRLAFCCPGRSPTKWTPLGALERNERRRCYEDLVYLRPHNLFICVTQTCNGDDFEAWDVASDPPKLRWENRGDLITYEYSKLLIQAEELLLDKMNVLSEPHMYLVFAEQTDQLFFVTRHIVRSMDLDGSDVDIQDLQFSVPGNDNKYPYKTVSFDVYKLDWELDGEGGRLRQLDVGLLDGLAMFVGLNHSFAVLATEANRLKPNSIYFTDDIQVTPLRKLSDSKYGGHDIGIFDYVSKTISPCYYLCDVQTFKRIRPEPFWFIPSEN